MENFWGTTLPQHEYFQQQLNAVPQFEKMQPTKKPKQQTCKTLPSRCILKVEGVISCLFSLCLSQPEALPKKKHQSRQIQTSNAPTFPQHTLRGPAGSASATPTSSTHGPVYVLSGSYVAARSSTAASLPALMQHTVSVFARVRSLNATTLPQQQLPSLPAREVKFLTLYQLLKETASKVTKGKERGWWLAPPAKSTRGVTTLKRNGWTEK